MTKRQALLKGVNAAVLTAMQDDLAIDADATAGQCRWLLDNGCDNLAILGTTGEANSMALAERMELVEALVERGIPAARLAPGTSTPNIPDTVALTRHAESAGCKAALLLPPFYYKSPSEDGLFGFFSEVVQRVGGEIGLYLYHFPLQSAVPITIPLIERLLKAYPGKIRGLKDSVGDLKEHKAYIDHFAADGFEVYTGADVRLQESMKLGAAGCITATSNITSALAARICADPESATLEQEKLTRIRKAVALEGTIPAIKTLASHIRGLPELENLRPPLTRIPQERRQALINAYEQAAAADIAAPA